MATFSRTVTVDWAGSIMEGKGSVKAGTGAFTLPVTFPARIGEPAGHTSPEELMAASHAACYAMACSNILAKAGTPPASLSVSVDVTADTKSAGWTVTSAHITVRGDVPGATEESFRTAAEAAKDGCPISRALAGNVELSVEAIHAG